MSDIPILAKNRNNSVSHFKKGKHFKILFYKHECMQVILPKKYIMVEKLTFYSMFDHRFLNNYKFVVNRKSKKNVSC